MTRQVKARIRLKVPGGAATPAPPVGAALGGHGVNIPEFVKQFNARTADKKGQIVPIIITVFMDKKFEFVIKTPPTSELIKKKAGITKGVSKHKNEKAGKITMSDVEEIAKIKMPDLNALTLEQAKNIVLGSARSMGVDVVG